MKIIIAGNGKMGEALTRQLSSEGYDLTLIDVSHNVLASRVEEYDIMIVQGNCASSGILEEAGVKEADLLIATTNSDEVNLLCCVTAHAMNPKLHTIARIRNPEYSQQIYQMTDLFALSLVVNPDKQAAREIERLIKFPGFLKRETFAKGRAEIVELRIDSDSKLCGRPLKDLDSIVRCKVLVCTVLRAGKATAPDGNFILQNGDRIFVTAPAENLTTLLNNLNIITKKSKKVMICGGSRTSYYLAKKLLKSNVKVHLIESNKERCMQLAELLPNATIIHGDASNQNLLFHEDIGDFDAIVSLTGLDEMNIMISLYATSAGVRQVITKLGHLENSNILNYLPLSCIVNPKDLISANIVRYIRALKNQSGAAISVHRIADGQVEALEFLVDEQTHYCNVPLKNLKIKNNMLLCCIVSDGKIQIPNGDSIFHPGDTVVIANSSGHIIYQLNDIFEG